MRRLRLPVLALALVLLTAWKLSSRAALPPAARDALAWYDTLGFPDAKGLPYVRVATGSWTKTGNQTPVNRFVEGFLVGEEPTAFTVFICSVSDFKSPFEDDPYPSLTTVRFIRKTAGPAYEHVDYEVLDFQKISSEVLERVRDHAPSLFPGLRGGSPVAHRARIFAFARACLQNGFSETASELMEFAANIPDDQAGKVEPHKLRDILQIQIGHAVLVKAEAEFRNAASSWAELLKPYENFETRFPASPRIAYAREATDLLRKMIAEEAAHHPKPLEQMSPAERVAENIYQLPNLGAGIWITWIMQSGYPIDARTRDGKEVITPVHRLVDLGFAAVPGLIAALDDRRFTRVMVEDFHGTEDPKMMRVADIAQRILEHLSGGNFYPRKTDDGKLVNGTTRQQAEAWWGKVQSKGEKQVLITATAAGGQAGSIAARKLVEKYPAAALDAIEAGIRATPEDGLRCDFVEAAAGLSGDAPLAFLRSKLGPGNGLYSRVHAAQALFARGQPDAVPAMIEAWQSVQPRLPANDSDAYSEAGGLISFLATSGNAEAIKALGHDIENAPVDVRLAVMQVFAPWPVSAGNSAIGKTVSIDVEMPHLPAGEAGMAIKRLLASALDDTERRFGMKSDDKQASFEDPRVCDIAAFVLSKRWPEKYQFKWAANPAECDAQIATMRNRWRADNGLPPLPPPARIVIPAAPEADVTPLLDAFVAASDTAGRDAITAKIADSFGLSALPAVRSHLEKNAVFRPLAINLASRVREVRIQADAAESARKSRIASLKGHSLTGAHLSKLAADLESALPPDVRAVTFVAERAGDGTGFKVTIDWLAGGVDKQTGWEREMAVRCGNTNLYCQPHYTAEGGMAKAAVYRGIGEAFEKAIQTEIDAPVITRFRIQRSNGQ